MNGGNSGYIFSLYFEFVFCLKINMSRKTKISLRNLVFSNLGTFEGDEIEVKVSWELCGDTHLNLLLILKDTPELTGRLCHWRVMPRLVLHRCWIRVVLLVHQVRREIETVLLENPT